MAKKHTQKQTTFVNRKAKYEYEFIEEVEAGIQLLGTEIKSIRNGHVNMNDAYCAFQNDELVLRSLYIGEYKQANQFNHESRRVRKLLLKRQELNKWEKKTKEKGFTIIPYKIYLNERGFAKIIIALAQGKKRHDKRQTIKEREGKRMMARIRKEL